MQPKHHLEDKPSFFLRIKIQYWTILLSSVDNKAIQGKSDFDMQIPYVWVLELQYVNKAEIHNLGNLNDLEMTVLWC